MSTPICKIFLNIIFRVFETFAAAKFFFFLANNHTSCINIPKKGGKCFENSNSQRN